MALLAEMVGEMKRLECIGGPYDGELLEVSAGAEGLRVSLEDPGRGRHLTGHEQQEIPPAVPALRVGLYQVGTFHRWGRDVSVRVLHWRGEQ